MVGATLILTLTLDAASQNYFTSLRNKYYPKYCNYIEAHLTLFHRLPPDEILIEETLQLLTKRNQFNLEVTGIQNTRKGNAFIIASDELQKMHKELQHTFDKYLISKDRQLLSPHITVQNKVTAFKAKTTTEILNATFTPFSVKAVGIDLWLYLKGSWQKKNTFLFT